MHQCETLYTVYKFCKSTNLNRSEFITQFKLSRTKKSGQKYICRSRIVPISYQGVAVINDPVGGGAPVITGGTVGGTVTITVGPSVGAAAPVKKTGILACSDIAPCAFSV